MKRFVFTLIVCFLLIHLSNRMPTATHNPLLWWTTVTTSLVIATALRMGLYNIIFDQSHLPRKIEYPQFTGRTIRPTPAYSTYSLEFLLKIASETGFIITEECIIDNIICEKYFLNYKAAETSLKNSNSSFMKNYRKQMLLNKAIRFTLADIPRFQEVLKNYTPDVVLYNREL